MTVPVAGQIAPLSIGAWGAAGAAIWLLLVFGLPVSWQAFHGEITWEPTAQRMLGLVGFIVIYLVLGGAAPLLVDAHQMKEAIGYGLGWQGVFGQFVKPSEQTSQ
jgi:hypothetical protein